jgi:short-subunit dehydrogenase
VIAVSLSTRPFAVVTGASRGIGAAYARALAARGWDLLLAGRDRARLEALATELTEQHRAQVATEVRDLAAPDASGELHRAAGGSERAVDLLVNNAGFGLCGEFAAMPTARILEMLRLHVTTVVESMRLFLPGMIRRRRGAIINVSSVAGFFPVPYLAEYAATKAFLISFSQAVAEEVRPFGVRVQVCCPGNTATDFHATAGYRIKNLLGTLRPEDVAGHSLAALERGRVVVTMGWRERAAVRLSRCVPGTVLARGGARWMRTSR